MESHTADFTEVIPSVHISYKFVVMLFVCFICLLVSTLLEIVCCDESYVIGEQCGRVSHKGILCHDNIDNYR